jgi:UDP-N-acetylglucosamine 2-epimerase (non-hydrolysing)
MSKEIKVVIVAAARPNFMKVAPIIKCIRTRAADPARNGCRVSYRLVHTGQHYDEKMSDIFFAELGIPAPDINLEVGSGSHAVQTANVMTKFEPVCEQEKPDWVVVVGDVNSTMACTLVCSKLGIKVAHVEAGLRSYDRNMPEEVNRIVTDSLAELLLTPSADGNENLKKEGIPESKIKLVGNVMIDALVANLDKAWITGRVLKRSCASSNGLRASGRWCFPCTRARARCAGSSGSHLKLSRGCGFWTPSATTIRCVSPKPQDSSSRTPAGCRRRAPT